jgi:hypothetical protein
MLMPPRPSLRNCQKLGSALDMPPERGNPGFPAVYRLPKTLSELRESLSFPEIPPVPLEIPPVPLEILPVPPLTKGG